MFSLSVESYPKEQGIISAPINKELGERNLKINKLRSNMDENADPRITHLRNDISSINFSMNSTIFISACFSSPSNFLLFPISVCALKTFEWYISSIRETEIKDIEKSDPRFKEIGSLKAEKSVLESTSEKLKTFTKKFILFNEAVKESDVHDLIPTVAGKFFNVIATKEELEVVACIGHHSDDFKVEADEI